MKITNILLSIICLLLLWVLSLQYKQLEGVELIRENCVATEYIQTDVKLIKQYGFKIAKDF